MIILTVDTLRHDRLGATGHPEAHTPHIDALAAAGVTFTQATTPFPRTTPALASMLTGLLPHRHGSREVGEPMTSGRSLAALLTERGYTALGLSATRVTGPEQGLDQGFDRLQIHHDARGTDLSAAALSLIDDRADPDRPLLLWVHYADPHFPYLPPDAADSPCKRLGEKAEAGKLKRVDLFTDHDGIASAALPSCSALYDGEITATDTGIGALLSGLSSRGRDGGLVILSSDHGEHFGEEGIFYEHGPSLHDAALRIPLIIAGPGVVAHTDDGVARLEDVAPTVLAAAGVDAALWPGLDGAPLTDRLAGSPPDPHAIAVSESGSALHVRFFSQLRSGRADRRSCLNDPPHSLCANTPGEAALLYNHIEDRLLRTPLTDPATHARLSEAATHWPAEQARHRAARTATHKRTESPRLVGGYAATLTTHDGVTVIDPGISSTLAAALSRLPASEGSGETRSVGDEEALRALGYIE